MSVKFAGQLPPHIKEAVESNKIEACINGPGTGEYLFFEDKKLAFSSEEQRQRKEKPIFFDFESSLKYHLKKNYSLNKEPFAKALGRGEIKNKHIVDLTCGTGQDLLLMHAFGASRIDAFERNPYIYLLLFDALFRFKQSGEGQIRLYYGDYLNDNRWSFKADLAYFDPMYEQGANRKSLPRKEMRIFHTLLKNQVLYQKIFDNSKIKNFKKIIIKRPLKGSYYSELKPNVSFQGKSTRYDVYLT